MKAGLALALYQYMCETDGAFERTLPMPRSSEVQTCPTCGVASRKVFVAPRLSLGDARARTLLDATARTADNPPVVSGLPPRTSSGHLVTNPATLRLPRP